MRFELDNTLLDEIIFYMENQDGEFVLDTKEIHVVDIYNNDYTDDPDFSDEERFISLPAWSSGDGYRLMEKFAFELKNPLVRNELSNALNRNKGVFRAYRSVLEQYPETEKLWFRFKEQKMKNEVIAWYNALREEWGLAPIGAEPEDNSSLVLEDFVLINGSDDFCFTAETSNGERAGEINAALSAENQNTQKNSLLQIKTLTVKPEYRGMGLGKTLLSKLLEKADIKGYDVSIDIPSETDFFSRALLLEEFKTCMRRFLRSIKKP